MKADSKKQETWLTTKRIETLVDGVFAIAMTLLVVNLHIPTVPQRLAAEEIPTAILKLGPSFVSYFMSFFLLAIFWMIHHRQFRSIERANDALLWINIICLMFIALIPFTTYLNGRYGDQLLPVVLFECNMLIIGLIFYIQWVYASANRRLIDKTVDSEQIIAGRRKNLMIPAVSLVAIAFAFISPGWSTIVYIAIPFIHHLIE